MQPAAALNCVSRPRADSGIGNLTLQSLADEGIARLAERGSKRALTALYDRYHQRLYSYCYLLLQDEEDARDALQSMLARALGALQRGGRDGPLGPWLFRLADEEATLLIRARSAASAHLWQGGDASEHLRSGDDAAEERARLAQLVADLRELPGLQRSALLMRELSGLSHEEIGVALDISTHGARQAIFHARRSLAEFQQGRSLACDEVRSTISRDDGRCFRRRNVRAHLRDCGPCSAFAAAIPQRRADLHALAAPLAPLLASGLLVQLSRLGSGQAARGLGAGAAKTVGTGVAAKALTVTAIVVSAGAGLGAASVVNSQAPHPATALPAPLSALSARAHGQARGARTRPYDVAGARLREHAESATAAPARDLGADSPGAASVAADGAAKAAAAASGEGYTSAAAVPAAPAEEPLRGSENAAGGGAGSVDASSGGTTSTGQQPQSDTTRGNTGGAPSPHAHGAGGPPSTPPGAAHAAAERGGAAHPHGQSEAPSVNPGVRGSEAGQAPSSVPGPASSVPASELSVGAPESLPPSIPAADPGPRSTVPPEPRAAPEATATPSVR
jgi:RNA polymerase sigma factor (sigma-70 family)